ncbi:Nucleotide-binding, alpha-beta plait [Corchorus capsularis]|uniref:Nucleotide-binding, alpha-beta plait n=1 Tax=Corchorus capsularis TaxID=210143 RepID=A0A1R3GH60_COCAP|nr:Nucleotide-binding, alpha-beta plait [Corchorus capsularis]
MGKNRGATTGMKVHVFCPMLKDKRDAVRVIADRWKLSVSAAGWEPKRFIVVHVTPKSKPPPRILGVKGLTGVGVLHPPAFDPLVDMDPRLVVSFLDLPREADISALVLRFGGECELVWLNDKNALAVFSDPARAATAMRRLDHGSVYNGAVVFVQSGASGASAANNAWGGGTSSGLKGNPWKKAVVQEVGWKEDSWGGEESFGATPELGSVWKGNEAPIAASINRWSILDSETGVSSSSSSSRTDDVSKPAVVLSNSGMDLNAANTNSTGQPSAGFNETEQMDVVDDWEKAYD